MRLISAIMTAAMLLLPICSASVAAPVVVRCGSVPDGGIRHLAIENVWQIPAENEQYFVTSVIDAVIDGQGHLCIADFDHKNLVVLDAAGHWVQTIGREGEGPGESRDVRKVFVDDSRYGLLQVSPASIVWFHADGSPAGKVQIGVSDPSMGNFVAVAHAIQTGDRIQAWLNRSRLIGAEIVSDECVVAVAPDGSVGPAIYTEPTSASARIGEGASAGIDESKVYDIWLRRWFGDGRGGVWVAPERDRYVLQHWNAEGQLDREVRRDYEPVERVAQGRERIVTWFKGRGWKENQIHVGRSAPVVLDLRVGERGRLWVRLDQGGRVLDGDVSRVYDVYSEEGRYIEQVRLHGGADAVSRTILNDTMAVSLTDDPDNEDQVLALERFVAWTGSE